MKYLKIIALTVLCLGFVSVYAQQEAASLPERDDGPKTVQQYRTGDPNTPPNGQVGEVTMTSPQQSLTGELGNTSGQKQVDPELDPNSPRNAAPSRAIATPAASREEISTGPSPNEGPDESQPIDK